MPWPLSQDYNEAVQNPATCFADPELRAGQAETNALGMPMPCSGNFADVYQLNCPATRRTWAVKCFTRQIPGLRERYQQISLHLKQVKLPFMVDFTFLDKGIRVRGSWYPMLKMEWVEGFTLNQFVKDHLDKPEVLGMFCQIWVRLARRLREANIAHCDLQHGNVLLVPNIKTGALGVRLVDYDGMCVPALTLLKSLELGHPSFQHPQRLREGIYSLEVDRFSHLVIYTALRAIIAEGRPLWERYDNGDNLLFTQADFAAPSKSPLFGELQKLNDVEVQKLVKALRQAALMPLEQTPLLDDLVVDKTALTIRRASAVVAAPTLAARAETSAESVFAAAMADTGVAMDSLVRRRSIKRANPWLWASGALVLMAAGLVGVIVLLASGKNAKESRLEAAAAPKVPTIAMDRSDKKEKQPDPIDKKKPNRKPEAAVATNDGTVAKDPSDRNEKRPDPKAETAVAAKDPASAKNLSDKNKKQPDLKIDPVRMAGPGISKGWQVIFCSANPTLWDQDESADPNNFAVPLSRVPAGIRYLRIRRDGDYVVIRMTKERLNQTSAVGGYGWEGTNRIDSQARHLGLYDEARPARDRGAVCIHIIPWLRGWGFGHLEKVNNAQGYSWDGQPIAPTVFEIAVKKGDLTANERKKLLRK